MADKASFTPEEWILLLESPMMAGMAVSAAEPSGLFGMLKESFATGKLLVAAKTDAAANALVKAVAADFETAEGRNAAQRRAQGQARRRPARRHQGQGAGRRCGRWRLCSPPRHPRTPQPFKAWLAQISQNVAEAASEGGFLGFGGVQVSDAEKATLARDHQRLGLSGRVQVCAG